MSKLDETTIGKINTFPEEMTNTDVWKELGIDRRTVAKYRKWLWDALEGKKEKKLTKDEKKKLNLLDFFLWIML